MSKLCLPLCMYLWGLFVVNRNGFHMEIRFYLICLNDFYPLCPFVRGFVALWLKPLSCKQGIPASNPGSGKY